MFDESSLLHRYLEGNGVRLHYVEAGSGPLVVLLHGFPEYWYTWRYQIPALVAAGYRVVAPDLRGYAHSSKPEPVGAYAVDHVADDVARLIAECGEQRAVVIGHDWGGATAWRLAMRHPEVIERLVILNMPHPVVFARALRTPQQLLRSWYIFFFQLPWLPEALLASHDYAVMRQLFENDPVRPGAYSPEDVDRMVKAMAMPGAATAAINYYRAAVQHPGRVLADRRPIEAPVLLIWGMQDRHLGPELAELDWRWVPNGRVEKIQEAGHFVQADAPDRVNELVLEFIGQPAPIG